MIKYGTFVLATVDTLTVVLDDGYVPGRRRRPPGHRFLGEHLLLLALHAALSIFRADKQPRRERNTKEHQVLDGYRVHHRGERRPARVLLLQPNERNCG
jgi:hypothetical protein